ncbi:MAG TPA: DUF481 domain-containing protein [Kiritimatiellia bacterium]|nr:DUF481 domain-containing protein [Kiritimatiellia bacterium]
MQIRALFVAALLAAPVVMAEEAAPEPKALEASLALGVTVNDGNTENNMVTLGFGLTHHPCDRSTLRLALDGAYGETEGDKTTENGRAAVEFQYLVSERTYGALVASVATDDIADLDYRLIVSPSVGYYLMKSDAATMTAEVGPALVSEKKAGETEDDIALRIAERYERTMNTSAKFWQTAEYLPNIDDFEVYLLIAEVGVEAPVSEKLNVRLVVNNTYDSDPAPGRKNNDVTVIGALAYSLF